MRIAAKLTLALLVAITVALGIQATINVRRVEQLHLRETQDDLLILGRVLAGATAQIWQRAGEDAARAYVRDANERRDATQIELVDGPAVVVAAQARAGALALDVPLQAAGPPRHVELRRSLDRAAAFRSEVRRDQVVTTLVLIVTAGLLALLMGFWLIGRPVEALIDQTRRVAQGELSARTALYPRDELGRLARELDLMTQRLADAQGQVAAQRQARTALQEQLRHADRLSTVGRVASGIAHELGTPLNVVTGRAAMIAGETDLEEIQHHAGVIVSQSKRMTSIIRELLDFSRRHRVERQNAEIDHVLGEATTLIEPLAERQGITIVTDLSEPGLSASLDVNKTLQVLTNLMMNAVQAMPDGGQLSLEAGSEQVAQPRNDHAEPGGYVVIRVRDEGGGIREQELEQIFQPFFTTKGAGRGTGLGLYVCQGIVREQSGWIDVDSTPGQGSTFSVYLPQEPPEAA